MIGQVAQISWAEFTKSETVTFCCGGGGGGILAILPEVFISYLQFGLKARAVDGSWDPVDYGVLLDWSITGFLFADEKSGTGELEEKSSHSPRLVALWLHDEARHF